MDALIKINGSDKLDDRTKKSVATKIKYVSDGVAEVERIAGLKYPAYFVEPVLTVTESNDNIGGLGVLYARTIPVETGGKVHIVVQLTAPLVLLATKATIKLVLAHEFLHYLELVRSFVRLDLTSELTANTIFEERYADSLRAIDPSKVFSKSKKLVRDLKNKTSAGLEDEKLNEKCRLKWIEKGLPMAKIPIASNQIRVSVSSIVSSSFDDAVRDFVLKLG